MLHTNSWKFDEGTTRESYLVWNPINCVFVCKTLPWKWPMTNKNKIERYFDSKQTVAWNLCQNDWYWKFPCLKKILCAIYRKKSCVQFIGKNYMSRIFSLLLLLSIIFFEKLSIYIIRSFEGSPEEGRLLLQSRRTHHWIWGACSSRNSRWH